MKRTAGFHMGRAVQLGLRVGKGLVPLMNNMVHVLEAPVVAQSTAFGEAENWRLDIVSRKACDE